MALRPIRGNCEQCIGRLTSSDPARCARCISYPTSTTPAGRSTCWYGSRGASGSASQLGIHWHVASKVEYVAADAERQNITWCGRGPQDRQANVYTSQPRPSTTAPAGEIRTVTAWTVTTGRATSCNRRIKAWTWRWRMAARPVSSVYEAQGVAALTAAYADREQALRGIDSTVRGYYQKTYPLMYAGKQPAINAAIACLQTLTTVISFRR